MNTLSRHDAPSVLLHLVDSFLEEVYSELQTTEAFEKYRTQYEESYREALNCLEMLKDKLENT